MAAAEAPAPAQAPKSRRVSNAGKADVAKPASKSKSASKSAKATSKVAKTIKSTSKKTTSKTAAAAKAPAAHPSWKDMIKVCRTFFAHWCMLIVLEGMYR